MAAREAEALRERGVRLFGETGLTLRRAAGGAADAVLAREVAALGERWRELEREAAGRRKPGRLHADEPVVERLLRRFADEAPWTAVAEPKVAAGIAAVIENRLAGSGLSLELLPTDRPAFAQTGVDSEIDAALAVDVPLQGAGCSASRRRPRVSRSTSMAARALRSMSISRRPARSPGRSGCATSAGRS